MIFAYSTFSHFLVGTNRTSNTWKYCSTWVLTWHQASTFRYGLRATLPNLVRIWHHPGIWNQQWINDLKFEIPIGESLESRGAPFWHQRLHVTAIEHPRWSPQFCIFGEEPAVCSCFCCHIDIKSVPKIPFELHKLSYIFSQIKVRYLLHDINDHKLYYYSIICRSVHMFFLNLPSSWNFIWALAWPFDHEIKQNRRNGGFPFFRMGSFETCSQNHIKYH